MPPGDVRAGLDAIEGLRTALVRYHDGAESVVRGASLAIVASRTRIASEVDRRRSSLSAAESALSACRARRKEPCFAQERRVAEARDSLDRATRALRTVDAAAVLFLPAQHRFARETTSRVAEGRKFLGAASADLTAYLNTTDVPGDRPPTTPMSSAVAAAVDGTVELPGGVTMVALDRIDDGDSPVSGPASFRKGYSPDDLAWSYTALSDVVLPALAAGQGRDHLRTRDLQEHLSGIRSYSDCYAGFFGDDAIRLGEAPDGTYTVANGYHRLWVARRVGLTHVPARIVR